MNNILRIGAAALLLGGLAACSMPVKDDDPYAIRVRQLEQRVDKLDRIFKNQSLVDLAQNMDQLQSQVRDLRGQIQELQHDMDGTKQRQRDLYLDLDRRLRVLELGGHPPASGSKVTGTPAQVAGGGISTSKVTAGSKSVASLPAAGSASAGTSATPVASGIEQKAYEAAFSLLRQGRYSEAMNGFHVFLKQYPDSSLDDNAQYWIGEINYYNKDFKQALTEFQTVLSKYPGTSKTPDALLKIGYCYYELKQWDKATTVLKKVIQQYPGSTTARLATERLQLMKKQGH